MQQRFGSKDENIDFKTFSTSLQPYKRKWLRNGFSICKGEPFTDIDFTRLDLDVIAKLWVQDSSNVEGSSVYMVRAGQVQGSSNLLVIGKSFIAGGISGSLAKTVIAPLDRTKILFQVSHRQFSFKAVRSELVRIVREEGPRALFKGNLATVARYVLLLFCCDVLSWQRAHTPQKFLPFSSCTFIVHT